MHSVIFLEQDHLMMYFSECIPITKWYMTVLYNKLEKTYSVFPSANKPVIILNQHVQEVKCLLWVGLEHSSCSLCDASVCPYYSPPLPSTLIYSPLGSEFVSEVISLCLCMFSNHALKRCIQLGGGVVRGKRRGWNRVCPLLATPGRRGVFL